MENGIVVVKFQCLKHQQKCEKNIRFDIPLYVTQSTKIQVSVATALAGVFAILVNKICKIMEIFE